MFTCFEDIKNVIIVLGDIQISWVLAELLLRKGGDIMSKKDFLIFFQTMTIFLLIILLFKTFN